MLHINKFFIENFERIDYLIPIEKKNTAKRIREGRTLFRRSTLGWVANLYRIINQDDRTDDDIIDELLSPIGS